MQLIRGFQNIQPLPQGCVATIGNFDGVHLGHQDILAQVREKAAALNLPACVVLFEPQPREFFTGEQAPARVYTLRDKLEVLAAEGVDTVLCLPFNEAFRSLTADEFIQTVLVDILAVRHLVVGDDFRFGCDRSGNFARLASAGKTLGFSVDHTRTVMINDERVSSTRIRQALAAGDFVDVNTLLGRTYLISGKVSHGQRLGRSMGVPTANIVLKRKSLPVRGVFAVRVHGLLDQVYNGVANVGSRPTVAGQGARLEVHLLDYQGDLYGQRIQVEFLHKIRDEQSFRSISDLKAAIADDIVRARVLLNGQ
ncbi:bifunctional riboflavin kinase/FAD synthetase [Kistimonas asteriae]|uniref:bifunctional riboflavin kinase/FAD synthetase n=1 Tax=Kistimonas asteriae TaxID=517724 RepID=UPI001BA5ABC0|nr:bifunctional riboflavin kinase/FAD synthetase [Kistimonas asteriae]